MQKIRGLEDEIMEKVIQNYEMESFSPMKGLLFGNLMSVMLIQMQKMKLHLESALLAMDQVLTSNELTMAATAAIPAVAISFIAGYSLYSMFFKMKAPKNMSSEQLQLRLAFTDIERAITSMIDQIDQSGMDTTITRACLEGPPHLDRNGKSRHNTLTEDSYLQHSLQEIGVPGPSLMREDSCLHMLSRDELLVMRWNGLLVFQASKFAQQLKPLFLSRRHVVDSNEFSMVEYIRSFCAVSPNSKWHIPILMMEYITNFHPKDCMKCSYSQSGIGARIQTEYDGIKRDILDLTNPLISPSKKLEITARMRSAYHCLSA